MEENSNETIVINDLLTYISCKHSIIKKNNLVKAIGEYYSEAEVVDACETLQESVIEKLHSDITKPKNLIKAVGAIIEYMKSTPVNEQPSFVCRNLNNLPPRQQKQQVDGELRISRQIERIELKKKHLVIKSQLFDLASVVLELRDKLKEFSVTESNSPAGVISQQRINSTPRNGLAYLQKLIDDEQRQKRFKLNMKEDSSSGDEVDDPSDEEEDEFDAFPDHADDFGALIDTKRIRANTTALKTSAEEVFKESVDLFKELGSGRAIVTEEVQSDSSEMGLIKIIEEFEDSDHQEDGTKAIADKEPKRTAALERSVYICGFCKFTNDCKATVQRHIDAHSEHEFDFQEDELTIRSDDNTHQCLLCLEEFPSRSVLKKHARKCPTISIESHAKKQHPQLSLPQRKHVCPVCKVFFASSYSLISHKAYHSKSRVFQCSVCAYRFYSQENLNTHFRVHTEGIYKCPYCEYGSTSRTRVMHHIHCHTGYKPYQCGICHYRALTPSAICRHERTHSERRDFACAECNAEFKTKDKLAAHKRTHSIRKPYKCVECGKGFKTPTSMKVHHRTHTDYKPHACPKCPYRARTAAILRIHSNIHGPEKPFWCTECDFRANQKSYLSWHVRAYHPKE